MMPMPSSSKSVWSAGALMRTMMVILQDHNAKPHQRWSGSANNDGLLLLELTLFEFRSFCPATNLRQLWKKDHANKSQAEMGHAMRRPPCLLSKLQHRANRSDRKPVHPSDERCNPKCVALQVEAQSPTAQSRQVTTKGRT
jgi:hypothetical protein